MEHEGWVKLYRSIQDSDIWNMDIPFCPRSAFIDLILWANHKNGSAFNKRKVNRGQHWSSLNKLSERWHWRKSKVKDFLLTLQLEKMITVQYERQGLMITILNYDKYQSVVPKVTTNVTADVTADVTATGPQTIRDI